MMMSNKKSSTTMKRRLDCETSFPTTTSRKRVRFHYDQEDYQEHQTIKRSKNDDQQQQQQTETTAINKNNILLTEEICQQLWFQRSDLATFRTESRKIMLYGKQSPDDETTGLERFSLERSRRKHAAIKCVLLAQNKGYDAESLRIISTKLSQEPLLIGMLQGFNIYCQVYDPLTCLFGENNNNHDVSSCSSCGADYSAKEFSYDDALFGEDNAISTNNDDHDDLVKEEFEYNSMERLLNTTKKSTPE